ncbi:hypothetical protein FSB78_13010 [Sphingomonas ginsenosidivorax]|uniref:Uncharacterized protein n=1 Tax=Sphingomonas ginsenosidivorax TaxID=862135 RepID=A0A5C6UHT1_9SPHN|nr:hypothetical protein [Sphingomonas ginsenosidivorax]TXC71766.1 hypothetical protein FSB78_13010 [Sphingomonas ginsenosidivorax]
MSWQVLIMFAVAGVFGLIGIACLVRLASPRVTQGQVYAFRMIGIMLVSGAIVLAMSAGAMQSWAASP